MSAGGALGRAVVDLDGDLAPLHGRIREGEGDVRAFVARVESNKPKLDLDTTEIDRALADVTKSSAEATRNLGATGQSATQAGQGFASIGRAATVAGGEVGTSTRGMMTAVDAFSGRLAPVPLGWAGVGLGAATAGLAVGKFAVDSVSSFITFEEQLTETFTLLPNISESAMAEMSDDVRDFSTDFGIQTTEAIEGLYQSLSSGIPQENVFSFMEQAAKTGIAGASNLTTAVDALSSATNAYGSDTLSATQASDTLFTGIRLGKTTLDQLAGSLSKATPLAAALGVEFDDLVAAIVTLTSRGVPTEQAVTQISAALNELASAGSEVGQTFADAAGVGFREFIQQGGSLQEALTILDTVARESGVGINDLFGSVEAGRAVLLLTGSNAATFTKNLTEMDRAAGSTETAYETMSETGAQSLRDLSAAWGDLKLTVGEGLAGPVTSLAEALAELPDSVLVKILVDVVTIGGTADTLIYKAFIEPFVEVNRVVEDVNETLKKQREGNRELAETIHDTGSAYQQYIDNAIKGTDYLIADQHALNLEAEEYHFQQQQIINAERIRQQLAQGQRQELIDSILRTAALKELNAGYGDLTEAQQSNIIVQTAAQQNLRRINMDTLDYVSTLSDVEQRLYYMGAAAAAAADALSRAGASAAGGEATIAAQWTEAARGVQHYETAISGAEQALAILDDEQAENGVLTAEQQEQYGQLEWAVRRYAGGVEDSEGAIVNAAIAQANYTLGLDELNAKYDHGRKNPAAYAEEVKNLAAGFDPAIGQQDVLIASLGTLEGTFKGTMVSMALMYNSMGLLTDEDFEIIVGATVEEAEAKILGVQEDATALDETTPTVEIGVDTIQADRSIGGVEGNLTNFSSGTYRATMEADPAPADTAITTVTGNLQTYADGTYRATLDVDRSALDTNLGIATDAIDSFMLGGAAPGTTAGGNGTYTATLEMVTTPAIDAIADATIAANTYTVGPWEATATANTVDANQNIMNLTTNISLVPDAHSTAYLDIGPAIASLETLRSMYPQSPAETGPLAFVPDWSWLTAGAAADMQPGIGGMVALLGSVPIAAGTATDDTLAAFAAMPGGIQRATLDIGEIIRTNVLDGFESTADVVGITSEQMATAIATSVQSGANTLPDVIHLMSTDVIAELVRLRDDAANALTLAQVAGTSTDEMGAELARLDALLLDYATQTGQSAEAIRDAIADGLDTTAIEEQVLAGWLDLLDDLDEIISGDLQADLLSQIASLQAQMAAAAEVGAPEAVIAAIAEQIAALEEQLALVRTIAATEAAATQTSVNAWLDVLDDITSGNVATAFETHAQRIRDLQQQLRLAILDPSIPPEVTAALQAALAQAQADFAGMQDALRSALVNGLVDDATLQSLAEAGGAAFETFYDSIFGEGAFAAVSDGWNDLAAIPLDELNALLPKLEDHGLSLIETLIDQVAAGERPFAEAMSFIESVLGETFKDAEGHIIDSSDVIIEELEQLEAALLEDLAAAYLENADAVGPLLEELETLRALLAEVRAEADGTKNALDTLPHNTSHGLPSNSDGPFGRGVIGFPGDPVQLEMPQFEDWLREMTGLNATLGQIEGAIAAQFGDLETTKLDEQLVLLQQIFANPEDFPAAMLDHVMAAFNANLDAASIDQQDIFAGINQLLKDAGIDPLSPADFEAWGTSWEEQLADQVTELQDTISQASLEERFALSLQTSALTGSLSQINQTLGGDAFSGGLGRAGNVGRAALSLAMAQAPAPTPTAGSRSAAGAGEVDVPAILRLPVSQVTDHIESEMYARVGSVRLMGGG